MPTAVPAATGSMVLAGKVAMGQGLSRGLWGPLRGLIVALRELIMAYGNYISVTPGMPW